MGGFCYYISMEERREVLSKADRFDLVEELLVAWVKRHPQEWQDFQQAQAYRRAQLEDPQYATNNTSSMREVGAFPVPAFSVSKSGKKQADDLTKLITKIIPEFWDKNEAGKSARTAFFQRFKAFRLPDKV